MTKNITYERPIIKAYSGGAMRSYPLMIAALCSIFIPNDGSATESLEEIRDFANDICTNIEGSITRSAVEGKVTASSSALKLLGVNVSVDGTASVNNEKYKGIPFEKLPDDMKDPIKCKQELSTMMLKERSEIRRQKESLKKK